MCKIENRVNLDVIKTTFSKEEKGLIIREINQYLKQERLDLSSLVQIQSHILVVRYEVSFLKKSNIKFWTIEIYSCLSYKFTCCKLVFFDIFAFYYG